jgi:ubiquinone/menaquinone biosynthesis C-methylase UbiE
MMRAPAPRLHASGAPPRTEPLSQQYDNFSTTYSENFEAQDEIGNRRFYECLSRLALAGARLLDIGCGDGTDLMAFRRMGATPVGIEPSEALVSLARRKAPGIDVRLGAGEQLPFATASFDIVVSKYAIQTSPDVPQVLAEAARVLKPGGHLLVLSKHPLRQFLEKLRTYPDGPVDYFQQDVVDSYIFEHAIHLREPSHTMAEYLSRDVLAHFDLQGFVEDHDFPASEQINGHTYPTFFIVTMQRRDIADGCAVRHG